MSNFIYVILYYLFFGKLIYVIIGILVCLLIYKIRKKAYKFKTTFDKGHNYYKEKEYEKALKCYSDAIDMYPKKTVGYVEKCSTLVKMKKPKEVLEVCNKWLQLDSNDVFAYYDRIWAYTELNEFDNIISDATTIINLNSLNPSAYSFRAFAYLKNKQFNDAIADLLKSIEMDSENILPYDLLAFTYIRVQQYNKALEYADISIKLDKSSASAYKNYAYALIKLDKLDLAKQYIDKAIDLKENYGNIYIVLSMINLLENDLESFYKNLNIALHKKVINVDYFDDSIFDNVREDPEFIKISTSLKDRCH